MVLAKKSKKVAVALSGGVDSSVACALLKKQGFDVVGFHMRLWKTTPDRKKQTEIEDRVKQIGKVLGVKVFIFDFKKEFKKCVVDYFIDSYKRGITPNPCVVCNDKIKFGLLMQKAKELGCDYLSTGHYVKKLKIKNEKLKILRAKNLDKDQSYFLWQLKQKQLKHILFPLGEIESKQKVREMAKEFGLPTYETPESNDVCFLQNTDIHGFLNSQINTDKGNIIDVGGNILGEHKGLWFYTIGQRKGIELSSGPAFALLRRATAGKPWFVVGKDIKKNSLIVSQNEKDLFKKELIAREVNWLSGIEPKLPLKVLTKVRYGAEPSFAVIKEKIRPKKYKIVFTKPQRAITPGQSVVFYLGNDLLGGGIIN